MLVETQTDLLSDIARIREAIAREAEAIDLTLKEHPSWSAHEGPTELSELGRQLFALRHRVNRALSRSDDPLGLRAELATLMSFAETLRSDAEACRDAFEAALRGIQRREAAARREREQVAAERGALVRRRDTLQARIDATAERMARDAGGECRRTVPVLTLAATVTVCSSTVVGPRRRFRSDDRWLITLNDSRDEVIVRRCYA